MIAIRNVSKSYGPVDAVREVSLDIRSGEFFSLLGASGCGKTTLLRMIAGFEGVSSGEIVVDGYAMQDMPPHLRPVNMVFQNYAIFPHLNVRDNIAYGLRRMSIHRTRQHEMVDEMLELIALPGFGDRRATQLSGGQMQRVALARALILKPKVLLLDEPLGALDKQLRKQMQLELRALQKSVGITFLLVTHDQEEALTLSDRVAVMSAGRVLQMDTPAGLYENPRNREVAGFIGNMNFFTGTVVDSTATMTEIDVEGIGRQRVAAAASRHHMGMHVLMAIRPEKLMLVFEAPVGPEGSVAGILHTTTYLGETRQFYVKIGGKADPVVISAQNQRHAVPQDIEQGRAVWLTWGNDAFVVLDHE